MRKTFKYRIYPTRKQARLLEQQLEECRWLYNHWLEQKRDSCKETRKAPTLYQQQAELPALKLERDGLNQVHSQVLQNVAVRLDLAFQAFFRRVKKQEKTPDTHVSRLMADTIASLSHKPLLAVSSKVVNSFCPK